MRLERQRTHMVEESACLGWATLLKHTRQAALRKYYDAVISLRSSINHVSFNSILDLLNPMRTVQGTKENDGYTATIYYEDNSLCQDIDHSCNYPLSVQIVM